MALAEKLYGPSGTIEEAEKKVHFRRRVARHNSKANTKSTRPFRSKAKKWVREYEDDAPDATFTFYDHADPSDMHDKMMLLQRLGVHPDNITTSASCEHEETKIKSGAHRLYAECEKCKAETVEVVSSEEWEAFEECGCGGSKWTRRLRWDSREGVIKWRCCGLTVWMLDEADG